MSYPRHSLVREVLSFCSDAVGVFYNPSRLGCFFPKSITPKVNALERLEFKLAYYNTATKTVLHAVYHHHHHHVVPPARISLILSRHVSLSFIAFGWSSGLHPVSSYSCCMYVRTGRPAFAWPYAGVHRSTSLMSSSLLLQQCPACLVRMPYIDLCKIYILLFSQYWFSPVYHDLCNETDNLSFWF